MPAKRLQKESPTSPGDRTVLKVTLDRTRMPQPRAKGVLVFTAQKQSFAAPIARHERAPRSYGVLKQTVQTCPATWSWLQTAGNCNQTRHVAEENSSPNCM